MADSQYEEFYLGGNSRSGEDAGYECIQPVATPAALSQTPENLSQKADSNQHWKKTGKLKWLAIGFAVTTMIFVGMFAAIFAMLVMYRDSVADTQFSNSQLGPTANARIEKLERIVNKTIDENNQLRSRTDAKFQDMTKNRDEANQNMNKTMQKNKQVRLETDAKFEDMVEVMNATIQENNQEIETLRIKLEEKSETITELQSELLHGRVEGLRVGWSRASNNRWYKHFNHEWVNYETAKSRCEVFGAKLVHAGLRTATLRSEIKQFRSNPMPHIWVGLDDLVSQGNYVWADGVVSTSSNTEWYPGQPALAFERCVVMGGGSYNGRLGDVPCTNNYNYLCEF